MPRHALIFSLVAPLCVGGCDAHILEPGKKPGGAGGSGLPGADGEPWGEEEEVSLPPLGALTRLNGDEQRLRLGRLFPIYDSNDGFLDWYEGSRVRTLEGRALTDRPTSALAQNALRTWAVSWCTNHWGYPVYDERDVLMPGEAMPAGMDEATRAAFGIARKVWLYPHAADDKPVQVLADVYRKSVEAGSSPRAAKHAVCVTALVSPAWWFGTPQTDDLVRRLAFNLGHRHPTFAEYAAFRAGTLTAEGFVDQLMGEPGYVESVVSWHQAWLQLAEPERRKGGHSHDGRSMTNWAATAIADDVFTDQKMLVLLDGGTAEVPVVRPGASQNSWLKSHSEACELKEQPFDATTSRVVFEELQNGSWVELAPSQVTEARRDPDTNEFVYCERDVQTTACRGRPVGTRRVRRISGSGVDQNGYSPVKLWYSQSTVYVCNTLMRHFTTCAFRPPPGRPMMGYHAVGQTMADPLITFGVNWGGNSGYLIDSLAHPEVLAAFSCGVPNPDAPTEAAAWPKTPPYNELIISGRVGAADWAPGLPGVEAERDEVHRVADDLYGESANLIAHIVRERLDYRELLTADWTLARGPLELLYRSRGRVLPKYPPGARLPTDADYHELKKVRPGQWPTLSKRWFQNSQGNYGAPFYFQSGRPEGSPDAIWDGEAGPRPMAGILTQPAFLKSAGNYKVRSVAAKIFRTLTCTELASFTPKNAALHEKYVFNEDSGRSHLDRARGCYHCHVALDPVASALSRDFMVNGGARGELQPWNGGVYEAYGIDGDSLEKSRGALFDQEVEGVAQLGRVLADSPQFASCTVRRTFEALFGRAPGPHDRALLREATEGFSRSYDYSAMVRQLVLSPDYLEQP